MQDPLLPTIDESVDVVRNEPPSTLITTPAGIVMKRRKEGTVRHRVENLAKCVEERTLGQRAQFVSAEGCHPQRAVIFRIDDRKQKGNETDLPSKSLRYLCFVKVDVLDLEVRDCGFDKEGKWGSKEGRQGSPKVQGRLSRLFPITIPMTLRSEIGIPETASAYAFAYPASGNSDSEQNTPLETNGGFLYFDDGFVNVLYAIAYSTEGSVRLPLLEPHRLTAADLQGLKFDAPFHTFPESWKNAELEHVDKFRWVEPQCKGADPLGIPLGFPSGGFCFLGGFNPADTDEESKAAKQSLEDQRKEDWWQRHVDDLIHLAEGEQKTRQADITRLKKGLGLKSDKESNLAERKDLVRQARARFTVVPEDGVIEKVMFGGLWLRFPYAFMMIILLVVALFSGIQMQMFFCLFQNMALKQHAFDYVFQGLVSCIPLVTTVCSVVIDQLVDLLWDTFDQPYLKKLRSTCMVALAPDQWTKSQWSAIQTQKIKPGPGHQGTALMNYVNETCVPDLKGNRNAIYRTNAFVMVCLEVVPMFTLICQVLSETEFWIATPASWLTFNINAGRASRLLAGYYAGLLANVVILTVALTAADIRLHYMEVKWRREPHTMYDDRGPRWVQESIEGALGDYRIFPSFFPWRLRHDTDDAMVVFTQLFTVPMSEEQDEVAKRVKGFVDTAFYRGKVSPSSQQGWLWPAIMWVPWITVNGCMMWGLVKPEDPWSVWYWLIFAAVCMAMATWGTSQYVKFKFPDLVGLAFHCTIGIFSFFLLTWIYSGRFVLPDDTISTLSPMMNVTFNESGTSVRPVWPDPTDANARPYSICQQQWGSTGASVSALDLAALSWIAYDPQSLTRHDNTSCNKSMTQLLGQHFSPAPRVLSCKKYETYPPRFFSVMFGDLEHNNTIVIAVKGTSTGPDLYMDIDFYGAVKVLQTFSFIAPVLQSMPSEMIQKLVYFSKKLGGAGKEYEAMAWGSLTDEIHRLEGLYPRSSIVLTGHSFGGALAQIAAAQKGKSALVWSAPGTLFSAQYFQVTNEAMQRDVTSVVPDMDVVPRADVQQSVVQRIQCKSKDGSLPLFSACHPLMKTACEVWRVCGDEKNRDFNCSEYVNTSFLGKLFPDSSYSSWR